MRAVLPAEMSSPPPPPQQAKQRLHLVLMTLAGIVASLLFLMGAFWVNARWANRLFRIEDRDAPLERIAGWLAPVDIPLVLSVQGYEREEGTRKTFLRGLGLSPEAAALLPSHHPQLVSVEEIARYNPYPPLLEEMHGPIRSWLTFGYLGTDKLYHQITHYDGESDTTPSPFLPKVRGDATRHGDYYVSYTVYGKKDPLGRPEAWDATTGRVVRRDPEARYLLIDRIDWSSYAGGSYDGLETASFAVIATVVEAVVVYSGIVAVGFRRFRRRKRATWL